MLGCKNKTSALYSGWSGAHWTKAWEPHVYPVWLQAALPPPQFAAFTGICGRCLALPSTPDDGMRSPDCLGSRQLVL